MGRWLWLWSEAGEVELCIGESDLMSSIPGGFSYWDLA